MNKLTNECLQCYLYKTNAPHPAANFIPREVFIPVKNEHVCSKSFQDDILSSIIENDSLFSPSNNNSGSDNGFILDDSEDDEFLDETQKMELKVEQIYFLVDEFCRLYGKDAWSKVKHVLNVFDEVK